MVVFLVEFKFACEFVKIRNFSCVIIRAVRHVIIIRLKSEFEKYNSLPSFAQMIAPYRRIIVRFTLTL